jgi:hypothetical protein
MSLLALLVLAVLTVLNVDALVVSMMPLVAMVDSLMRSG